MPHAIRRGRYSADAKTVEATLADQEVERLFNRLCGTIAPEQLDRPATLRSVAHLLARAAVLARLKTGGGITT